jgi:hypothetical protein
MTAEKQTHCFGDRANRPTIVAGNGDKEAKRITRVTGKEKSIAGN